MYSKIIKNSIVALAAITVMQGCSKKDIVDLTPDFTLDAITNPSSMRQVEEVLIGAYASLRANDYYGSGSGTGACWSLMPDVMSDNLYEVSAETLANSRAMADWIFNQSTGQIRSMYTAPYATIANANIVLRDVDKFTTSINQGESNRIKGQAYALRALAHFDLMRYFSPKYDRASTSDFAVAYVKEFVVSTSTKLTRATNKDFYDNLFADINQAITLLGNVDKPVNATSAPSRPYMDRNAAYALLARVNLYAGNWAEAATAATNAINGRPLATTQAAFSGMYNQTNVGELIFNVQFESGQFSPTFLVFFATSNRSYFRPVPDIATTAGTSGLIQNNDLRYQAYFTSVPAAGTTTPNLAVTKYRGKAGLVDGTANYPVFRSGEMYLIRAEANARLGGANEVSALADLNTLRAARISGYTPVVLTGTALINAIADERRREMFGEGHRFFDLKRTTRTVSRGTPCGTSISASGACTLASTAREWAMPIPEDFLNANRSLVQNPGY